MKSIGWTNVNKDGDPTASWRSGSSWNRGFHGPIKVYKTKTRAESYQDERHVAAVEVFINVE